MTTQYDSASFEADLDRAEQYFEHLYKILDNKDFRGHVDATAKNFEGTEGLINRHENLLFKLLMAKGSFEEFAERIRSL